MKDDLYDLIVTFCAIFISLVLHISVHDESIALGWIASVALVAMVMVAMKDKIVSEFEKVKKPWKV